MSEDLEALVRRGWDAYNRGDVDATLAIFDPELVVCTAPPMANAGTYHGKQGFLTWIGQWNEAWDAFTIKVLAVEAIGEHHVLTRVRQSGTGRSSGVEVTMNSGWVFDVRDGLCVYLGLHSTLDEARADALARESTA